MEFGFLFNVDFGIFFEFILLEDIYSDYLCCFWLDEVEVGVNYVLIINNNVGFWGYNIGDIVQFVFKDFYCFVVFGWVKYYILVFGEYVIGKEVEEVMNVVVAWYQVWVVEYIVVLQVSLFEGGIFYYEWFVEFQEVLDDVEQFVVDLDWEMV